MGKKFLFLYLNTGGGHIGPAKAVKQILEKRYGTSVQIDLYNGFHRRQVLAKCFFEFGYRFAMAFLPGIYSLTYEWTKNTPWLKFYRYVSSLWTTKYLKRYLADKEIDTIVSFHFALSPAVVRAIKALQRDIAFVTVVTDPFTAHPVWFLEKRRNFIVFSEQLKSEMVGVYGIREELIHVMPFLVNPRFLQKPAAAEIAALKQKHGFPADKKIVLLAGGGEGLPGAIAIVHACWRQRADFSLAVVCGRDAAAKTVLEVLKQTHPKISLKVFGFVPFMDELLKVCDCAVIKAGTSSLLEALTSGKPVIICKYIHGQELGNVRFAVSSHGAWFIRKPQDIARKITQLFSDRTQYAAVAEKISHFSVDTDTSAIAEYLINL